MKDTMENKIADYVSRRIYSIAKDEKSLEAGGSKARLAHLRSGIGKAPGEMPELWGEFLDELPPELLGKTNEPSRAEWAVYTALTLFALHQQGHSEPMNDPDGRTDLGAAARMLIGNPKDDDEVERVRFKLSLAANSEDMTELAYHLKTLVRLFSRGDIRLDYRGLAADLFRFQSDADKVRLKWGRSFYYGLRTDDGKEDNNE